MSTLFSLLAFGEWYRTPLSPMLLPMLLPMLFPRLSPNLPPTLLNTVSMSTLFSLLACGEGTELRYRLCYCLLYYLLYLLPIPDGIHYVIAYAIACVCSPTRASKENIWPAVLSSIKYDETSDTHVLVQTPPSVLCTAICVRAFCAMSGTEPACVLSAYALY
eukprot:3770585-Rhodomonas_salina.1